MAQLANDISVFTKRFGCDPYPKPCTLPIHKVQSLRKLQKRGLSDDYFVVDHPRVWKKGNKIKAFTISLYNTKIDSETVRRYIEETSEYTNGRYIAEAFTSDKLNVYFDKDAMERCYQTMDENKFRQNYLSKHVTIVLIPTKAG